MTAPKDQQTGAFDGGADPTFDEFDTIDTIEDLEPLDDDPVPQPQAAESSSPLVTGIQRRPDLPLAVSAFALYALAFVALEPLLGIHATALAAGPAIVAAWYWGARGAMACAAAMGVLHVGIAVTSGDPLEVEKMHVALQAAIVALVAGGGVGGLRDRERTLRQQWARQANRLTCMERSLREEPEVVLPEEPDDEVPGARVTFTRCEEPSASEDELEELLWKYAFHDQLTDLPNRALLVERLDALLDRSRGDERGRVGLLLLDLDRFKVLNDSLGHLHGDRLLSDLARRVRAAAGAGALVARLGGDEFAVVLSDVDSNRTMVVVAERILKILEVPFTLGGHQAFTSGSLGLVRAAEHHNHPRDMVRDAELAMTYAKSAGGGDYALFDDVMRDEARLRMALEHDLRGALARRQLHLNYQPIVDLSDGEIAGFEALVRWRHPTRGLVSPSTFIPMAEETGMIVPIGRWVLENTCDHLQSWHWGPRRRGRFQVNVNVSPRQLDDGDLPGQINAALSTRALPPSRLAIELTESAMAGDAADAGAQLQRLRKDRIQLCVDDFGTGYSSLSQLLRCPADTLKIDRSFVERMAWRDDDAAVVRTIVRLGHDLGMNVVAEGIENIEQLRMLRDLGCEKGQGYLFSRPMSPAAAGELLSGPPPWRPAFR